MSAMSSSTSSDPRERLILRQDAEKIVLPRRINLLALPKGVSYTCELCKKRGQWVCTGCGVTYYCSMAHFHGDKQLHDFVCQRLIMLRRPLDLGVSSQKREQLRKERELLAEYMREYSLDVCETSLDQGNYPLAIAAATLSMKYSQNVADVSLVVKPLMIMAESNLLMGNLKVAEAILARALSAERDSDDVQPNIKAQLRHNEGLLNIAKNDYAEAKDDFAEEIYQNSKLFGPHHHKTSAGYCYLGYVFLLLRNYATAASLQRKTVEIWLGVTEPIVKEILTQFNFSIVAGGLDFVDKKVWLDSHDLHPGLRILAKCYELTSNNPLTRGSIDMAKVCYAMGSLYFIADNYKDSKAFVREAISYMEEMDLNKHPLFRQLKELHKYNERKRGFQGSRERVNVVYGGNGYEPTPFVQTDTGTAQVQRKKTSQGRF